MIYKAYDENTVVLGMAGSGKTTFAKYFLSQLRGMGIKFLVWDVNRQYSNVGSILLKHKDLYRYKHAVYYPKSGSPEELDSLLSFLDRNRIFVLEEAHEYVSKHSFYSRRLEWLVRVGRNYGNTYIAISQRPADLHNSILSNAHHIIAFRLTLPRDIQYLQRWLGEDAKKLRSLPRYHYIYKYYASEEVEIREPVKKIV